MLLGFMIKTLFRTRCICPLLHRRLFVSADRDVNIPSTCLPVENQFRLTVEKMDSLVHIYRMTAELLGNLFRFIPGVGPKSVTCNDRLDGKTIVITGSNRGVGRAIAEEVIKRGATVIMGVRDVDKGKETAEDMVRRFNVDQDPSFSSRVQVLELDLASLESVKQFADRVKNQTRTVDVLVNNAGIIMRPTGSLTKDGFEVHFGTNYLGHFLLTLLMIERLKQSQGIARIVHVSSNGYAQGKIQDIELGKSYSPYQNYAQSKLAVNLFNQELARRLRWTNIRTYAAHPGFIKSETKTDSYLDAIVWLMGPFRLPPKFGAQTPLMCIVDPSLESETGCYYANCAQQELLSHAMDQEAAKRLWTASVEMVVSTGVVTEDAIDLKTLMASENSSN